MIPYGRQSINDDDIQAVTDVLRSDWLTQGPAVERFEKEVADYCGCRYAIAVNSATSALHIACLAAGLGPGQILWTSPNTFVASANCGLYCGADVDFVDIEAATANLSVRELELKLSRARALNRLPKVLVPVHFAGQSCDMSVISDLAKTAGCNVIEDASHAIGGRYRDSKIGSCEFSDMTVFSFHPVKIITTGEGGVITTNRRDLHEKLLRLRSHGITRDPALMSGETHGPWYYQQIELGFNYRMTDIQAALGESQIKRLDAFVQRRRAFAQRYDEQLSGLPMTPLRQHPDAYSPFHLYVIRLRLDVLKNTRRQVFELLRDAGINVNLHYIPVHTHPYYRNLGFREGDFPASEQYYQEVLTLPLYPDLTEQEQDFIIATLRKVLQ